MKWVVFFSQSGSEICNLIEELGIEPYTFITNNPRKETYDSRLLKYKSKIKLLERKLKADDYLELLDNDMFITLHGYLRIIPAEVVSKYKIYNLHPGLITKYPQLKGLDPQKKAVELGLETSGCVIHEVSSVVDSGNIIIESEEVDIKSLSVEAAIDKIKEVSLKCWVKLFKEIYRK